MGLNRYFVQLVLVSNMLNMLNNLTRLERGGGNRGYCSEVSEQQHPLGCVSPGGLLLSAPVALKFK